MQYIKLRDALRGFTVFSLADIRRVDAKFHRRRLNEWQGKGYIKKVVRGYYVFSELELGEEAVFEIANRIYQPSYISFEAALSYYGLIPEIVYGVTSASTRKTCLLKSGIANFSYRTIKPPLFFGYNLIRHNGRCFKIAAPEKAILDYLYINPQIKNPDDFSSLRINKAKFKEAVDKGVLRAFLGKFAQRALAQRLKLFLEAVRHA
jgi:predicted transcriptional regulator of viral defense system